MNQSSNPALSSKAFNRFATSDVSDTMTVGGTLLKAGLSFIVLLLGAGAGWALFPEFGTSIPFWTLWVGLILTFLVGIWAAFQANVLTVSLYAILVGTYLGFISRSFQSFYDGIVVQAVLLTLAVTLGMFFLYGTGLVKVTQKFRSVIIIATVGLLIYLVAELLLSVFIPGFLSIVTTGLTGFIIGLVIVIIAALNLLLDFDTISRGVANRLSKKAEWYAAFGLMVTLIWLYLSILRMLAAARR